MGQMEQWGGNQFTPNWREREIKAHQEYMERLRKAAAKHARATMNMNNHQNAWRGGMRAVNVANKAANKAVQNARAANKAANKAVQHARAANKVVKSWRNYLPKWFKGRVHAV